MSAFSSSFVCQLFTRCQHYTGHPQCARLPHTGCELNTPTNQPTNQHDGSQYLLADINKKYLDQDLDYPNFLGDSVDQGQTTMFLAELSTETEYV